jgi:hypothetical protein
MDRTRDDDDVRDNQLKRGDRDGGDDGGGNDCEDEDDVFDDANSRLREPGESRHIDRSACAIMEEEEDNKDPPCLDSMCGIESRRRVAQMAMTISHEMTSRRRMTTTAATMRGTRDAPRGGSITSTEGRRCWGASSGRRMRWTERTSLTQGRLMTTCDSTAGESRIPGDSLISMGYAKICRRAAS